MIRSLSRPLRLAILSTILISPEVGATGLTHGYRSPAQTNEALEQFANRHKKRARLHDLGKSAGGRPLMLLEVGEKEAPGPAILVVANMQGDSPPASEAALALIERLLGPWREKTSRARWYIVVVGNPDGYAHFFGRPRVERFTNATAGNDDHDDRADEDGPVDLNDDGFVTLMRQKHPEGEWLVVEEQDALLKKANRGKGERGTYRLFTEGLDTDRDGAIAEDAPGGVNPGKNFPHNFQHYTTDAGRWAASEPESRALLRFAYAHPEIAMVLVFGRSNNLRQLPSGSGGETPTQDKVKLPASAAKRFGLDPEVEYPIEELVQMARDRTGMKNLTAAMVMQFIGVGAASKLDEKDRPYYEEAKKRYQDFIKQAGLEEKRLDSAPAPRGSVEDWAYYQFGVPSFSMDFWSLPKSEKSSDAKPATSELTPEKLREMSAEAFLALDDQALEALIKASGTPSHITMDMVRQGVKSGRMTLAKIADMVAKAAKKEEKGLDPIDAALYAHAPEAFVAWKPFEHPTLGRVEIGGRRPWAHLAPPHGQVQTLLEKQLPFVLQLVAWLPRVSVERLEVTPLAADVWRIRAWVTNAGTLPYPTYQGVRCQRPSPIAVTLAGQGVDLIEGRERQVIKQLDGSGGSAKLTWVVRGAPGRELTIRVQGFAAGRARQSIQLKEGVQP